MKWFLALLIGLSGYPAQAQKAMSPTYARDIRPILQARCVVCHNQETLANPATSGGLALDTYAALRKGVSGKPIFTPGKAGGELIDRLSTTSPARLMPRGGPALPPEQIALFKKWIEAGAPAGNAPAETGHTSAAPATLPMPAPLALQDISLKMQVKPGADLLPKTAPKNPDLAFALKIGPLPPVTALAYSPDGALLAVGSYRAVVFWNTKTGQPVSWLTHLSGSVQALAFRPDGTQIAIAGGVPGASGDVRVVDTKTLAVVGAPLQGHTDVVLSVAWNPAGNRLATGGQDKTVRIWEWPSGKEAKTFKDHSDAVTGVCFAPDGKSLYTASLDHSLHRYDCDKGTLLRVFTGHNEAVNALAVTRKGDRLLSSGVEPNIRWWNPDNGDTTNNNGGHSGPVNAIVISADGKFVVTASADHVARLWDANSTGQIRTFDGANDWLYTAAFSPDGKFTAAAGADGIVRLWETSSGRLRLMLLDWPPAEKATQPDWAAITPEGFYDGSPAWCALLRPQITGPTPTSPQLAAWVRTLHQPDKVAKAWQNLDPTK